MNRVLPLALLSAATALSACTVGPNYRPATTESLGVPDSYSVGDAAAREDLTTWWTRFDDPMLQQLAAEARTTNLDVAQAIARLRQAREGLVQSRADLLPSVSGSGGYSRREPITGGTSTTTLPDGTIISTGSGSSDSFSLGADASWQADIFGGNRRGVEASRAALAAAGYDYAAILVAIQGEIARNYILARANQAQLDNARATLAIQDDNLEIAGFRVQAGLVSSIDVEQARVQRAQTAASIPSIESAYASAVARLGVLTGRAPGALRTQLAAVRPIPTGPASVGVGIPADTLRQRPDVRVAERNLAAAVAQIGVAEAQLYPQLSLGGSIDTSANALDAIGDIITGRIFSNIAQLIFDAGRTRSQVRSQQAAADAALANYRQTALTALEDVENAVVALDAAQRREREFAIALDAATNSALLSRLQYQSGLTDFTTLNQVESSLLSARNGVTQARADQATALIQLYTALGGGWDETQITDPAPVAVLVEGSN
ncbi:efflux transporter outer membrane subunit [Sphingomonas sp. AX6]|uniref:efflux transporter outer membrane subunit n=1 Tax=Sphingomonas sp. AX6 TaxID=2653171 RepID=UPI0012F21A63|nr:efflux transporter outer membrane subunit [Sphingomonas sp. AX6]VXC82914.1 Efflux transporter outer membrane subunit [Sphingomonas sp. AX6]